MTSVAQEVEQEVDLAEIQRKVNKAKLRLMTEKNTTFFSALLASLWLKYDESFPTAATDGVVMHLNPRFLATLDVDQTLGLLLHETLHAAYEHMDRRTSLGLQLNRWNAAGDFFINNDLDRRGYKLPDGGLIDHRYDGLGTREIYDLLSDSFEDFPMDVIIVSDTGDADTHREQVITNILRAAMEAEKSNDPGSIPSDLRRKIEELENPQLPWNVILQNHMTAYAKDDYSWSRPNRRYWPEHYLPGLKSEALEQITVAVDTSGSISDTQLTAFMGEIRYLWSMLSPKKLRLMSFDTEIHEDCVLTESDTMDDLMLSGGGGTNCEPVIETIRKDDPEVALIFTDGEFYMPDFGGITSDLIWIVYGNSAENFKPGIGNVIQYTG